MPRPVPRLVKGFRDIFSADVALKRALVDKVRTVYEAYGFVPLETPAVEYVDVLGKFLPESVTPAGGIFAFRNPDVAGPAVADDADSWLSLRYDLTAPLARIAAQYPDLPKPFRRYQVGPVWRYEKPGPGRFREFMQMDFDAVGVATVVADAEACCVMCDALEAIGFARGEYLVKVSNRKVMQGVLESCGLTGAFGSIAADERALAVLRAIDKLDRLGERGVVELLGRGRKDESGDFMPGANLSTAQIDTVLGYLRSGTTDRAQVCARLEHLVGRSPSGAAAVVELRQIDDALSAVECGPDRVTFDPTIIRGLAYYTGPVFEGVITKEIVDDEGQARQFGAVYGGGRYDDLVERFTGAKVPATGASIGVDRLLEAAKLCQPARRAATADVLIVVIERDQMQRYLAMANRCRTAGIKAETYLGEGGMRAQIKYADRLGIPFALICGGNEIERGVVQIKDLVAGAAAAANVESREAWRSGQTSQVEVPETTFVEELSRLVNSRSSGARPGS